MIGTFSSLGDTAKEDAEGGREVGEATLESGNVEEKGWTR